MKGGKRLSVLLLALSMMLLMGCGGVSGKTEGTDGSAVVQVPEGGIVESLFSFSSIKQISMSGAVNGFICIGNLENENSVVWNSDSVFLYVQGEVNDVSGGIT